MLPKLHRYLWMPAILLVFITASFIYLALTGGIPNTRESYLMILGSYLITGLLFGLRLMRIRRDRRAQETLQQQLNQAQKQADSQQHTRK